MNVAYGSIEIYRGIVLEEKSNTLIIWNMHEAAQWDAKSLELGTRSPGFQPRLDSVDGVTLG